MNVKGYKDCPHCNAAQPILKKVTMSLVNNRNTCDSCGKIYTFSNKRRWVAFILLLIIIFSPTILIFVLNNLELAGGYMYIKYVLALIVFYVITGNSHASNA